MAMEVAAQQRPSMHMTHVRVFDVRRCSDNGRTKELWH